jgi:hypothetical protein
MARLDRDAGKLTSNNVPNKRDDVAPMMNHRRPNRSELAPQTMNATAPPIVYTAVKNVASLGVPSCVAIEP